jgi:hypothetical protein
LSRHQSLGKSLMKSLALNNTTRHHNRSSSVDKGSRYIVSLSSPPLKHHRRGLRDYRSALNDILIDFSRNSINLRNAPRSHLARSSAATKERGMCDSLQLNVSSLLASCCFLSRTNRESFDFSDRK